MENSKIYFMGLAGGYLVYLGVQQFIMLLRKEASLPWLSFLAGLLFIVFGSFVVIKQWQAHKALTAPAAREEDTEEEDEETEEETEGEDEE